MSALIQRAPGFIGLYLAGFFYGIYSGIFAIMIHLQYQTSQRGADDRRTTFIFYALCILYVLSAAQVASDITRVLDGDVVLISRYNNYVISAVISGCCDFMSQSILIYRCWIGWNRNNHVAIIPSILAFAFLGTWMVTCAVAVYDPSAGQVVYTSWARTLKETSLAISLIVNALVTGLIVLKIFKVYSASDVKRFYGQSVGLIGGDKLRTTIFIVIQCGMSLFSIQLARLVVSIVWTDAAVSASQAIIFIHQMLNGIIPTIFQVRIMKLVFHDQPSLVEITSGLRFVSNPGNSSPEMDIDHDIGVTFGLDYIKQ